jgi:hypothetical protein
MILEGVITKIMGVESGTSRSGKDWSKQNFILTTDADGKYPKNVCLTLLGDKLDILKPFAEGSAVKAHINISSRDYNDKWFTEVSAWKIEKL